MYFKQKINKSQNFTKITLFFLPFLVWTSVNENFAPIKIQFFALASVAQLVGAWSHNQDVTESIPGQGTHLGCNFKPQSTCGVCDLGYGFVQSLLGHQTPGWMHVRGNQSMLLSCIDVSHSPLLSKNKKRPWVRIKKKIKFFSVFLLVLSFCYLPLVAPFSI